MSLTERAITRCFLAWTRALAIADGAATPALFGIYIRKAEFIALYAADIAKRRGLQ